MKRIACLLIIVLIGSAALAAVEETDPAVSPDITSAAYGARPLGMGGAFVALSNDTNAVFTNPAGLSQLYDWSVTSMSTKLLTQVDYTMGALTYRWGVGTIGLGYVGTTAPCGDQYDEFGSPSGSPINYTSSMVLLSYGLDMASAMKMSKSMGNISVGASAKLASMGFSGIDKATASGTAFDLGLMLTPKNFPVTYGVAFRNIGGALKWESGTKENIEGSTRLGACARIIGADGFYAAVPGELLGSADIDLPSDKRLSTIHIGLEYRIFNILSVRAGLDQGQLSKTEVSNDLTAGVGVEYSGFRFDYAYRKSSQAEDMSSHYFSLSYAPENYNARRAIESKDSNSGTIYEMPKEYEDIYVY